MNFSIPRQDNTKLLLYLWKIIDLPYIHLDDLLYRISYELFIFPPEKAIIVIKNMLKDALLEEDDMGRISLSPNLNNKLELWQKNMKNKVLGEIKLANKRRSTTSNFENDEKSNFNILIKSLADKGTINRAVNISNNAFEIKELDAEQGIIRSTVLGSKEVSYHIEINLKEKLLKHNCHDFVTRKRTDKQFCKHLVKFCLLLLEKYKGTAEIFLKDLGENYDVWDFEG
jgi:hypothetical protein